MTDRCLPRRSLGRLRRAGTTTAALAAIACIAMLGSPQRAGAASRAAAAAPAAAVPPQSIPPQYEALAAKLKKQFPEYSIDSIRPSGVDGVVEVLFGGSQIIYSDTAGDHIFNGHLFDLQSHRDLTDERLEEVTRIDVKKLPLADSFDIVHGNGKREIYVFEDPDCPYCRKLEEQLPQVNDVRLHVFLYPLTSIHPHAYEHALGIWCSKDRSKAWLDKMLKGIDPPAAKCDNPLERNLALGEKLHVDGTPTLILANGRPHSGTVTAAELEKLLGGVSAH
ncbi:MAG TPA: DsbC family protein [Steroidobacteraceae bacterium]|jgi:thiol:disulfide interchange protein DsbC|nr:DsbC family protein [Steroidobacteraceae bacterium]